MSFKEAIIIPYDLFKKCQFEKAVEKEHDRILHDTTLPSDVKMKLYNQAKALDKVPKPSEESKPSESPPDNEKDKIYIVQLMPTDDQPFVSSILDKIEDNKDQISWNENLEVRIDSKLYRNSNIIELLRFVMKKLIITSDADVPIGAIDFVQKLYSIGVPKSWMRVQVRRRTKRLRSDVDYREDSDEDLIAIKQKGSGWLVY